MSKRFKPERIVGGAIIAELDPISYVATARFRGAEMFDAPRRARRVVVREPHEHIVDEGHFLDLFQNSVAQTLALAGTIAPQVVCVLGRDGRAHALVEEELSGVKLDSVLRELREQGRRLPVEVAVAIVAALVGLWKLPSERGFVVPFHVGPAEILVTATGGIRVQPELADERARQTVGAAVFMTEPHVAYVSPEQVDGNLDANSGMFTLGLILYELLAGTHPVVSPQRSSMMSILAALREGDLPPILEKRDVPRRLAAFVGRATARDALARFDSWDELMVELDAALGELPPCGSPQILNALPRPPVTLPELDLGTLDWRALPHDGLVPIAMRIGPRARPGALERPTLAPDFIYGRDSRPMLACGRVLVDVRPVTAAEYVRFALATGRATVVPPRDDVAATNVSFDDACAYAAWAGKRLPTEAEWAAAVEAIGADRLGTGEVWEWTVTEDRTGRVVRGGRWRNALHVAPRPANRSFEIGPAVDLGFRCVRDT